MHWVCSVVNSLPFVWCLDFAMEWILEQANLEVRISKALLSVGMKNEC